MPLAPLPYADPQRLSNEGWFGAERLEAVAPGAVAPAAVDRHALDKARRLTKSALSLRDAGDGFSPERAARLHVLAAEAKRLNGAERECQVDYTALARLYLGSHEIGAAIAYMRKSLYVADLSPVREDRVKARLLAAEVYLAAEQGKKAADAAGEAAALADDLGDPTLRVEADRLQVSGEGCSSKLSLRRCPCGKRVPYAACCGLADEIPAEFLVRIHRTKSATAASPYWTTGTRGLDLIMTPSGAGGREPMTFHSWRVEAGRHRLLSYPNWTGRALAAARKMADLAAADPDGTEAPASAIMQACCALEAFETVWKFFMRQETGDTNWPGKYPQKKRGEDPREEGGDEHARERSRVPNAWQHMWSTAFGADWKRSASGRKDMSVLFELRHAIVHSVGDPEQVVPAPEVANEHVVELKARKLRLRPTPATWADRVLTQWVADWAVEVAAAQVAEVRAAFAEFERRTAMDEIFDEIDPAAEEEGQLSACG